MSSTPDTPDQRILQGDSDDILDEFEDDYFHAIVTDPPYNLSDGDGFMGREWDAKGSPKAYQEWCEQWASAALRVLKPGGHLIAFSGNRTHHRLFSAVEDAGFEIRDTLTYHYGTGFPKGSDVGKYIDRYYDAEDEREVVGTREAGESVPFSPDDGWNDHSMNSNYEWTAPATSEAEQWDGWRSQLKPATEFAVLARAPMSESAVYRNVLEHGTGALNIDRTRIPTDEDTERPSGPNNPAIYGEQGTERRGGHSDGRYPANLLLDRHAARMLDEQSGELESGEPGIMRLGENRGAAYGAESREPGTEMTGYGDSGGASRFFYTAKASKSERTINGQIDNDHPTVKPLSLMEYLVTLVTAPGQRVLDPFAGSGTTIMACRRLNREGIGIEKSDEHAELARKRVALAHELETERVPAREDTDTDADVDDADGPATLESFADADDD